MVVGGMLVFVLDFDGGSYGSKLSVEWCERMRKRRMKTSKI